MHKIAIIGTGRLGTRLAEQFILDNTCSELYLWNRSQDKLDGTILSLNLWKSILKSEAKIDKLNWAQFNNLDAVVIAIKERYDPRILNTNTLPDWLPKNMRYVGIFNDFPILREICNLLINFKGKVIILTNPVDIMTSLAKRWLKNSTVIGLGTTLDSARLTYYLNKLYSIKVDYSKVLLFGEHGADLFPIYEYWDNSLIKMIDKTEIQRIIKEVQKVGFDIVKNLGYSLQDCALIFSHDISWLLEIDNHHTITSLSYYYENACLGLPVSIQNGNIIFDKNHIPKKELIKLKNIELQIANIVKNLVQYFNWIRKAI